jgi:hypothetical protein
MLMIPRSSSNYVSPCGKAAAAAEAAADCSAGENVKMEMAASGRRTTTRDGGVAVRLLNRKSVV